MTDNEYEADLRHLDEEHDPSKVAGFGEHVPDGTYQARLDKIYVARVGEKKALNTIMQFEISGGEHKFRKETKFARMESADNLDFLTSDLRKLGAPRDFKWSDVEQHFPAMLDAFVEITVKTKNGFTNIYINKALSKTFDGPKSDDDVPF
jgi:hypothetical protein